VAGKSMFHADIAAVVGPTASGKSTIAETAAQRFGAAIISVDSVQVYRGMDIGTAKPTLATRNRTDYRMIDVCDIGEEFTVQAYQSLARGHLNELVEAGSRVIVAGGSGLHFRALVDPLTFAPTNDALRTTLNEMDADDARAELVAADAMSGDVVDLSNPRRVVRALEILRLTGVTPTERARGPEYRAVRRYEPLYGFKALGVDAAERSGQRIHERLGAMLDVGLLDEVARVRPHLGASAAQAVGYKEFFSVLDGTETLESGIGRVERASNALVKRQRTYFRRDPRITWLTWQDDESTRISEAVDGIGEMMQWTS